MPEPTKNQRSAFVLYLYEQLEGVTDEAEGKNLSEIIEREERIIGDSKPIGKLLEDLHLKPWTFPEGNE